MRKHTLIEDALKILSALGFPKAQQNERSALCLLALLNLTPYKSWSQSENPLMGITPIMEYCRKHFGKEYAPNTRETFRRQTMHQFMDAGIVLYNPDEPTRSVNSPKAVYQIEPEILELLKTYGSEIWNKKLKLYLPKRQSLISRYAKERDQHLIPVQVNPGKSIKISPGDHSALIKAIVEDFGSRFVPGGTLIYVGDTGDKWGYFDETTLKNLNVTVNSKGKMPDVVIYCSKRKWLVLVESVTSHGPVDGKRHQELANLFSESSAGLVYVTAFPSKAIMTRYISEIAWETEVWVAEAPSHLIHFNGSRFLGPYSKYGDEAT